MYPTYLLLIPLIALGIALLLLAICGLAACMLSSRISQQLEEWDQEPLEVNGEQ